MRKGVDHQGLLVSLKRIEGQIRGIQKMIEEQRYCIDVVNTLNAAVGALKTVTAEVLKGHLKGCVREAFGAKASRSSQNKIDEVCQLIKGWYK